MRQLWGQFLGRRSIFYMLGALMLAVMPTLFATGDASASHSWGNYHWAVQTDTFTLKLGDNLTTAEWDLYHAAVSADWSVAYDLDTTIVAGTGCSNSPTRGLGRTEVCNKKYGATGWLGLAQIWVYSDGHIAKAHAKMNDTYFNTSAYNTPSWKEMVLCQEVGHTFGLAHQDEVFDNPNLGTCMDYTNNPDGPPSNVYPNQHDYDQLALIYGHLDSRTTVASSSAGAGFGRGDDGDGSDFGRAIHRSADGRENLFVKELGGGKRVFTWVFWAH